MIDVNQAGHGTNGQPQVEAETQRPDTVQDPRDILTAEQTTAMLRLLKGLTNAEAARSAGVHRNTVGRWRHTDPVFRAALEPSQQEMLASIRGRIVSIAGEAFLSLRAALEDDPRLAFRLLSQLGLLAPLPIESFSLTSDLRVKRAGQADDTESPHVGQGRRLTIEHHAACRKDRR